MLPGKRIIGISMMNLAEENYLKTIFNLSGGGKENVSTSAISDFLENKPSSVTDMLKKLSDKSLINYKRYNGAYLTPAGKEEALKVIRKHRLWELFLVKYLAFSWHEVHEIAEQMEHVKSGLLIDRLDKFLGYPATDPHGDPIPGIDGKYRLVNNKTLGELKEGESCVLTGVKNSSSEFLKYLNEISISLNTRIRVLKKYAFDGSVLVKIDEKHRQSVSKEVSKNLLITVI